MATARKAKSDPFLTLDVRDVGPVYFSSIDEVLAWINGEREHWQWATKSSNPAEIGVGGYERRDQLFSALNAAQHEFGRYKANPSDKGPFESAKNQLSIYAASGIVSSTPRAQFIASLKRDGDHMALAAFAAFLGEATLKTDSGVQPAYRHAVRQGRIAITLFDLGVEPRAVNAGRGALQEVAADNKQVMTELLAANQIALEALKNAAAGITKEGNATFAEHADRVARELEQLAATRDGIIKRLDAAHAQYTSVMELKAPVDYWTQKAADHKSAAFWWGMALALFAMVGTAALAAAFYLAYDHAYQLALNGENKFSHLLVLMSAGLLAATTIIFWTGRFLQRLYISERHMAIDAKQRAVMTKAFLALASNQNVDPSDRALVLAPLFRASSDGLIVEDREPDGLAATLAKALAK